MNNFINNYIIYNDDIIYLRFIFIFTRNKEFFNKNYV